MEAHGLWDALSHVTLCILLWIGTIVAEERYFSRFCLFFLNFIPFILQPLFTYKKDRLFQSHCCTHRSDLNSGFLLFCAIFPAWLLYSTMNMEAADSSDCWYLFTSFISQQTTIWMPDRDSVISMMTRLQAGQSWFCILAVARDFPSPKCPGQLWVLPSLLFNGCLLWGIKQ